MDNSDKFTYSDIVLRLIAEETCIQLNEKELSGNHNIEVQLVCKLIVSKRTVYTDDSWPCNNVSKPDMTCYKCPQR